MKTPETPTKKLEGFDDTAVRQIAEAEAQKAQELQKAPLADLAREDLAREVREKTEELYRANPLLGTMSNAKEALDAENKPTLDLTYRRNAARTMFDTVKLAQWAKEKPERNKDFIVQLLHKGTVGFEKEFEAIGIKDARQLIGESEKVKALIDAIAERKPDLEKSLDVAEQTLKDQNAKVAALETTYKAAKVAYEAQLDAERKVVKARKDNVMKDVGVFCNTTPGFPASAIESFKDKVSDIFIDRNMDGEKHYKNLNTFYACFNSKSNVNTPDFLDKRGEFVPLFELYLQNPKVIGAFIQATCDGKHGNLADGEFRYDLLRSAQTLVKISDKLLPVLNMEELVKKSSEVKGVFSKTATFKREKFEFVLQNDDKYQKLVSFTDDVVKEKSIGFKAAVEAERASSRANPADANLAALVEHVASGSRSTPTSPALVTPPTLVAPPLLSQSMGGASNTRAGALSHLPPPPPPLPRDGAAAKLPLLAPSDLPPPPPPLPPRDGAAVLKTDGKSPPPPLSRDGATPSRTRSGSKSDSHTDSLRKSREDVPQIQK